MSATYIIEKVGIDALDILIEEGKIERISTRQMLNTAECQNCNWNLIGNSDDSQRIVQKSEQHNMQAQHKIHVQAMQCYDIKFNDVIALHEYEKYKSKHNRQVIGETQCQSGKSGKSQSFYLNSDVKKGKMNLMIREKGHGTRSKVIECETAYDEIKEIIGEFGEDKELDANQQEHLTVIDIVIIAIYNRLEISVNLPGTSVSLHTVKDSYDIAV